jgi:hypothetical protein
VGRRGQIKADGAVLQAVAQQFGWSYQKDDRRLVAILGYTPPAMVLGMPRNGTVANVLTGDLDGHQVRCFHLYAENAVSGRGAVGLAIEAATKNRTEHTFCALQLRAPVPQMVVCRPEDWAARKVHADKLTDRYATGDASFDQWFVLTTQHPHQAVPAVTPALRQFVYSTGTSFAVDPSGWALTWAPGRITDGNHLVHMGRNLAQVATLLTASP